MSEYMSDFDFLWDEWKTHNVSFIEDQKKYCFPYQNDSEFIFELLENGKQKLSEIITFEKYCEEKGIE